MTVKARLAMLPPGETDLRVETVELGPPGPHEVLIEQRAVGVCHSQLDLIDRPGRAEQIVLGHESYGVVVARGDLVDHVALGDEVFLTWIPRNPQVVARKAGASRVTLADGSDAVTHNVFAWGTHALVDEQYVVRSSGSLPADVGSIIGCAVMTGAGAAMNTASVVAGDVVAVWGAGGVGLSAVAAAHALGAAQVVVVDVDDAKLALARELGATDTVNARTTEPVAAVKAVTGGAGVDASLDCTGLGANFRTAIAAVRSGRPGVGPGGAAVLVGLPRSPFEIDGIDLLHGQKRILSALGGSCSPERDFARFTAWYDAGTFRLDALVTDRYTLDQVNDAVADLRAGRVRGRAVLEL